jgi:hypothetical protein
METPRVQMSTEIQTPSTASPMEQTTLDQLVVTPAELMSEPIEVQVFANAGDESQEDALEVARTLDAIEEAKRSGELYEQEEKYDEYDAHGCHCLDCLNHDDPDYDPYYADERYNDDGYGGGLDWNESGYFD